jgi:hypothetical protein
MDKKTGELGEDKFNDGVAKSLELVFVQKVLPHFLNEASKLTHWKEYNILLIDIFKGLRKREDFTDADILLVKQQICFFTPKWLKLTGREGMTNCTHLIINGYIFEYMERWRNLYGFSNQGWERQNALIHYFDNHRAHSGDSVGRK